MFPHYATVRAVQTGRYPGTADSARPESGTPTARRWSREWAAQILRRYSNRLEPRQERVA